MANSWDPVVGTKSYLENLERIRALAEANGYRLNPDEERLKKVVGLMTMNFNETGRYYCPCKQSHPLDPKDILCPCSEMDEEIRAGGSCFCKLFFK